MTAAPPGDAASVSVLVRVSQADAFDVFTREINQWWRTGPAYRIVVPGWQGPSVRLISRGVLLHLDAGTRLIMCDEKGGGRVTGTFEELEARGMAFPLTIPVSRLNVRVREGVLAFVMFVDACLLSSSRDALSIP